MQGEQQQQQPLLQERSSGQQGGRGPQRLWGLTLNARLESEGGHPGGVEAIELNDGGGARAMRCALSRGADRGG